MKLIGRLLLITAGFYLLALIAVYFSQRTFIYFPTKTPAPVGFAQANAVEQVQIPVDGIGEISSFYAAPDGGNSVILFFHGNAENISTHFANVYWLVAHGYDVYLFDYRGYGQSEGEAELDPIVDDMQMLIGHVLDDLPANNKLIVMGQSLGASLSIYSVAHRRYRDRIEALVSVAAFSDYHDIAQDALSSSWVFWLFQWPLSKTISN